MKALIYKGSKKLQIEEKPVPTPKEGEALIKVKACGICGSDVHGYLGITAGDCGLCHVMSFHGTKFELSVQAYRQSG